MSSHVKLHLIILVLASTGIAGAMVTLDSQAMVWHRMIIAAAALVAMIGFKKQSFRVPAKDAWWMMGNGIFVAAHWITFFHAIKISNVSVALSCLASTSLFTSLLEPLIYRRRLIAYEVIFGAVVIAGLYIIFRFETRYVDGILVSLLSALTAVLFTIFNGKLIQRAEASVISFYEMIGGIGGLSLYLLFTGGFNSALFNFTFADLVWLIFLGTVCTAYAFVLTVSLMKDLSPFTIAVSYNLEPIYSILFALLIFGEKEFMTLGFYLGALLILATVFANAWLKKPKETEINAKELR